MKFASEWLDYNELPLNVMETKCMYMETAGKLLNRAIFPELMWEDQVTTDVNNFKYLGIMVHRT